MPDNSEDAEVLRPGAAAALAHVTTDTLADWVRTGKLEAVFTAGGQRRYRRSDIIAITVRNPE